MAIRISRIKAGGVFAQNEHQLAIAKRIEEFLQKEGIEGCVQISRFYADRWYDLEDYEKIIDKPWE